MYLRTNNSKHGPAGSPYYVGKGKGNRAFEKVNRCGCKTPADSSRIVFAAKNMNEKDAFQLEMLLIHFYGRVDKNTGCLRNLSDGGKGGQGIVVSEATRAKQAASAKARCARGFMPPCRKGQAMPASFATEMRRRLKGKPTPMAGLPAWNKGKKCPGLCDWRIGTHLSESHRKNLSLSHFGKHNATHS
jgi:hypothetical protein